MECDRVKEAAFNILHSISFRLAKIRDREKKRHITFFFFSFRRGCESVREVGGATAAGYRFGPASQESVRSSEMTPLHRQLAPDSAARNIEASLFSFFFPPSFPPSPPLLINKPLST